jgi:GTPase
LKTPVPPSKSFTAEICLIKGEPVTMIAERYQTMVHILHQKRTVQLTSIETLDPGSIYSSSEVVLRPGCRARVTFTFSQGPVYVRKGMRIILRDGHIRGIGVVLESFE